MKIIKAFLSITMLFLFMACSSDDSPENIRVTEDNIAATWKLTAFTMDGKTKYSSLEIPIKGEGKDMNATITLSKNPNTIATSGNFKLGLSANLIAQKIEQDIPMNLDLFVGNGEWSVNSSGQILVSNNGNVQTLDVKEFDNNTLKLQTDYEFNFPYNDIQLPITSKVKITLTK